MPAYVRLKLSELEAADPKAISGRLAERYQLDGFKTQYTQQTAAWVSTIPLLQGEIARLRQLRPEAANWSVLLEYPLYRLRRRIDAVILTEGVIVVVEIKVDETKFAAVDQRQAEEYALDLRDFHAGSHGQPLLPVLWCTAAQHTTVAYTPSADPVHEVHCVGQDGLAQLLASLPSGAPAAPLDAEAWDKAEYRPVPGIIEAATTLFTNHDVRDIARADAENLHLAATRLVSLIAAARRDRRRALLFLTGVPGSGKTLAGLQVVHDALATGTEQEGDIVYLSGNTPLVTVLREALAQDEYRRSFSGTRIRVDDARRKSRARIQHINDFLNDNLKPEGSKPPHEHAIVFDEAQRAWDAEQGWHKFQRKQSEPALLLDVMGRHEDWCACVCLIGGGQEINTGEQGVAGWGNALRALPAESGARWDVYAPPAILGGDPLSGDDTLGPIASHRVQEEPDLQLLVPVRSFRSRRVSDWVALVLEGNARHAHDVAQQLNRYPITLTRSLAAARAWLRNQTRGERRCGLVASSGARRLRADGLGQLLHAADGDEIAHWYLQRRDDIRSSYALEVPANEYTCQGLELDFVGLCWGGDMIISAEEAWWVHRRLSGSRWQTVKNPEAQRLLRNSYRVLLTRAREGLVIWVPSGDPDDDTRKPAELDSTAEFLRACGAQPLPCTS